MQFYASKIVSALIVLNTTICLAMQRSSVSDSREIGFTSVSCEDRVYNKQQISKSLKFGIEDLRAMKQVKMDTDTIPYLPKPNEVMPFQGKFYVTELNDPRAKKPSDFVVFAINGKFAKVVTLKEDGGVPFYIDCVSSSERQSPEQPRLRMRSPKQTRLRIKSPERSRPWMKSPKRPRLRMKSSEQPLQWMKSPERPRLRMKSPEREFVE